MLIIIVVEKSLKSWKYWSNKAVYQSCKQKTIEREKKLYKKYFLRPITFERQYKRIKNLVQRKISAAKIQYFEDKFVVCNNSKQKWDMIRSVLGISTQRGHMY